MRVKDKEEFDGQVRRETIPPENERHVICLTLPSLSSPAVLADIVRADLLTAGEGSVTAA